MYLKHVDIHFLKLHQIFYKFSWRHASWTTNVQLLENLKTGRCVGLTGLMREQLKGFGQDRVNDVFASKLKLFEISSILAQTCRNVGNLAAYLI